MSDSFRPTSSPEDRAEPTFNPELQHTIEALVRTEVQKQLDRETSVIKEAATIAIRVVAVAFAILFGIFTVFGLTTWKDIRRETAEHIRGEAENLIQNADSETGIKQMLNDLVNRAVVNSSLVTLTRGGTDFLLAKNDWDRLRTWVKDENLSTQEFEDTLAVLNAQPDDRGTSDANSFLSEMLSPLADSPFKWIRKQPEKRYAILAGFKNYGLGSSAAEIAASESESENLRASAANYVKEVRFAEGFEKLLRTVENSDWGLVKQNALIACAVLKPTDSRTLREIKRIVSEPARNESLHTAIDILWAWWSEDPHRIRGATVDRGELMAVSKQLLSFAVKNGIYFTTSDLQDWFFVDPSNTEDDRDPRPLRIIAWIQESTVAHRYWSASDFARFEPYWNLMQEAANAGDIGGLRKLLLRSELPSTPVEDQIWSLTVRIIVPPRGQVSVVDDSGLTKVIAAAQLEDSLLDLLAERDERKIRATWTEKGGPTVSGVVTRFSGTGFQLSLHQASDRGARNK